MGEASDVWDAEAPGFDDQPDHGLADPRTREAWRRLLLGVLPPPPARIVDLGCGTGTLARLLIDAGYDVTGLDVSPAMLERARAKVPEARFVLGDAADPAPTLEADHERRPEDTRPTGAYDVVLCRHVLWALPEPAAAMARWVGLLAPGGRLVLVEGRWFTDAGLSAEVCDRIVRTVRTEAEVTLLPEAVYWGRPVDDERYLLVSRS